MPTSSAINFDALVAEAVKQTGLADFGDDSFREPLRRLLLGLEQEAELNELGRTIQRERLLGFLINRLRFEELWKRHPEIGEEKIAPPLVIIGLGRTGTTMLQRLLAADERFYAPLWWETRFPVPFPGETIERPDKRIEAAIEEVRLMYQTVPNLSAIHPMDALQADEDILLLEQSFFSTTPESFARITAYGNWLDTQDQTPGYRYLKRLLQSLQWQKRKRGIIADRWLLKSPHHIHHTEVLLKVFPDAQIIQTHRDPVTVIPSWASLIYSLWRQSSDVADPVEVGNYWNEKMATGLERCLRVRDSGEQSRWLDIDYREAAADPIAVLQKIYRFIGIEFGDGNRQAAESWLQGNAREDRAPHLYTPEMFGFTEAKIRERYAAYIERFIR